MDQPQTDGQTRAGADPQTPHPVKWTHLNPRGQEELLYYQVAQSLRQSALTWDRLDLSGLYCEGRQLLSQSGHMDGHLGVC